MLLTCFNYWVFRMFLCVFFQILFFHGIPWFFLIFFHRQIQATDRRDSSSVTIGCWLLLKLISRFFIKVCYIVFLKVVCYVWYQRCWTISILMADHCLSPGDLEIQNLGLFLLRKMVQNRLIPNYKLSRRQIDVRFCVFIHIIHIHITTHHLSSSGRSQQSDWWIVGCTPPARARNLFWGRCLL